MRPSHIFIVGLPRTGTKLVKGIVQSSPVDSCVISSETFFFGRFVRGGVRDEICRLGDMRDDSNIERFLDLVYSGALRGSYWNQRRSGRWGISREMFRQALLDCPRGEKDIYDVMLTLRPNVRRDAILGDKTPSHLYHVPTMLEWYPEAKVIHTIRDPRAIVASEWMRRKRVHRQWKGDGFWPGRPFAWGRTLAHMILAWRRAERLHGEYERRYPSNYVLVRFEDLVRRPEHIVPELCRFLEIAYGPQMLRPRMRGSSFHETGSRGFHPGTLDHWNAVLSRSTTRAIELFTAGGMERLGYARD